MRVRIVTLISAVSIGAALLGQQFSSVPGQGRSMIVTKYGIVAAPQFLASQAGAHILEEGGNAADAAIAANAVMGVTQPYVNGMGGDLFALYYEAKTGKLYGLNSSGWTPKALTIEYLKAHHVDHLDPIGVHTIDVPGCVAGWDALKAAIWHAWLREAAGARHLLCGERISFSGTKCALLGKQEITAAAGISADVLAGRCGARPWRCVQEPGAWGIAAASGCAWEGCVL